MKRVRNLSLLLFLKKDFKFQPNFCKRSHNLLMMRLNLSDIAILNIKGSDHRCIINGTRKSGDMKLMQNTDLTEKSGTLYENGKLSIKKI